MTNYHTKVGDRFGSRVIVGFLKERDTDGHLRCAWKCDCGMEGTGGLKALRRTVACHRCKPWPKTPRNTVQHGQAGQRQGTRTKLYNAWANMRQRTNPHSGGERNRKWYSDKGIAVCSEWRTFEPFRDWALAHGYEDGLSLDRLDPRGNYRPDNCQWVTRSENSRRSLKDMWQRLKLAPELPRSERNVADPNRAIKDAMLGLDPGLIDLM